MAVEFGLVVTNRAAGSLRQFRKKMAEMPEEYRLTGEEATELQGIIRDLRKTLDPESGGIIAYVVTDKRIDVEKLLSEVRALLAPGAFDAMSEVAKFDFAEAGKCVAFERPTAAAFHLLRATEAVLRDFYCVHVRRGRVQPLLWGPMVAALRKKRRTPPKELLDNLDNIRSSFRNPTQHPEKIYDIQEAQDLFGLCIDVVNRMAKVVAKSPTR